MLISASATDFEFVVLSIVLLENSAERFRIRTSLQNFFIGCIKMTQDMYVFKLLKHNCRTLLGTLAAQQTKLELRVATANSTFIVSLNSSLKLVLLSWLLESCVVQIVLQPFVIGQASFGKTRITVW